jgi:Zn-dependent peptidase ImmA (M78 family)
VLIKNNLPREPKLFCLVHELKHHFVDQDDIRNGHVTCGDYNQNEIIEIAAEIFAAEFIFPDDEMLELINGMGINSGNCTAEIIVRFKQKCPAIISCQFITKRFERFGLCNVGQYKNTQFRKLEEELFGKPFYTQEWFKKYRAKKSKVQS